ncbi:TetR/AcrR family transcriptional regulator [Methylobacterium haplocladii]|nr:TetR/AcrR family transcriptional regulator [Methylobacterium haplocladii]
MSAAVGNVIDAGRGQAARREHILDAAETCFIRNGFHRTTMLDLAKAAAMSAGNFYRYFSSKEAIVLGLAERDRERGAAMLGELQKSGDRRAAFLGVLTQYVSALTREAAVLRLDIWSEATRNPAIAAMTESSEAEARAWFLDMFEALATSPDCDPPALHILVSRLLKGVIVDRALTPEFDPAPAVAQLLQLLEAGLGGRLPTASDASGTPPR